MMKVIKNISLLVFAILFVIACDNNDFEAGPEYTKAGLLSPIGGVTNADGNVPRFQVNDFVSIADISRGLVSRQWRIEEENSFLLNTFKPADTLDLESFVDSRFGINSNTQEIFVLLRKVGENKITYKGVFNDSTALQELPGNPGRSAIPAVQNGGVWELDVEFNYLVLDSIKQEATIATFDGSEILGTLKPNQFPSRNNTSNFETIEIEAGTTLKFSDITTIGFLEGVDTNGIPNTSTAWTFEGGLPETSTETEQDVTFNRTGEYIVDLRINRAQRGRTLPATNRTKSLPYIIKVVPSTQPFTFIGQPVATDDEDSVKGTKIINMNVNGELEAFTGLESNFTLNVTDVNSLPVVVNIVDARVDQDNASTIRLTLDVPIMNTDTVELSYSGTPTDITAVDGRPFEIFSDAEVTPFKINFLTSDVNPSFEAGLVSDAAANAANYSFTTASQNSFRYDPATGGGLILNRSDEQSSDGDFSMRFNGNIPLQGPFQSLLATEVSNLNVPAGDYKLKLDVFIETGSNFNGVFVGFQGGAPGFFFNFNNPTPPAKDTWVTVEADASFSSILNRDIVLNFRNGDNNGITGVQTFYIDNLKLENFEVRP